MRIYYEQRQQAAATQRAESAQQAAGGKGCWKVKRGAGGRFVDVYAVTLLWHSLLCRASLEVSATSAAI